MMLVQLKGPPTGTFIQRAALRLEVPWGSERDICVGVPPVKFLRTPKANLRQFCRQTATVERKDRVISSLIEEARLGREDVVSAAERIAGEVQRTPLIE